MIRSNERSEIIAPGEISHRNKPVSKYLKFVQLLIVFKLMSNDEGSIWGSKIDIKKDKDF